MGYFFSMKKKHHPSLIALVLSLFTALSASAQVRTVNRATTMQSGMETTKVVFSLGEPRVATVHYNGQSYSELNVAGLPSMSHRGLPRLPFYSFVIAARPQQIVVTSELGAPTEVQVGRLAPCPPDTMRCRAPSLPFIDQVAAYAQNQALYHVEYLGDYRGYPLSRVTLLPHHYDLTSGKVSLYGKSEFTVQIKGKGTANYRAVFRAPLQRIVREGAYDYLVLTSPEFKEALAPWIEFKTKSQNLKFNVIEVPASKSAAEIKALVAKEYAANKFVYALIVGDQKHVQNFSLPTTTSNQTPTDLPFYTMGGADDFIPDVLAGRLVAANVKDVQNQLKKWMDYEQGRGRVAGWGHGVGIASNEGSGPSDEEYVRSIEKLMSDKVGTQWMHFAQNDKAKSNPSVFNSTLAGGAMWAVYVGHGSGTSWPSFGQQYSVKDIKMMNNASAVKPVWIDVACQNGGLATGYAGERLSNEVDSGGNPIGTTAYYGGTVNVSWHPPAILARGITMRMIDEPTPILASVIQMGHAYLAEQISDVKEIRSNQIWYHLQGDPALRLHLKAFR
jgi:hypothetical protein